MTARSAFLALALATTALSPAFADPIRLEEFRHRLDDEFQPSMARIDASRERFERFSDLSDADALQRYEALLARSADTQARRDDTVRRLGEYRRSIGMDVDDAAETSTPRVTTATPVPTATPPPAAAAPEPKCGSTAAQEAAFSNAALADGVSERVVNGFDFSCPAATQTPIAATTPATMPEVDVAALDPETATGTAAGGTSPVGNYQLTWQGDGLSDFTTQEAWHPAGACAGGYGDACSDPANVSEANGVITLAGQPCSKAEGKSYCGSEITTRGIQNFTHGYIEVEAKTPTSQGAFHAAGWLMGNGTGAEGWPLTGEVDFAEGVNDGEEDGKVYMTAHWGGEGCPGGHCSLPAKGAPVVTNSEWNTYGLERTPDALRQYVNGQMTGEITREMVSAKGGNYDVLFNQPMHYRADMAAGGPWAAPNGGALEAGAVQIKDVRMYQ